MLSSTNQIVKPHRPSRSSNPRLAKIRFIASTTIALLLQERMVLGSGYTDDDLVVAEVVAGQCT